MGYLKGGVFMLKKSVIFFLVMCLILSLSACSPSVSDTGTYDDSSYKTTARATTTAHKHSFSDATCTSPKKCSCGETSGSALGHSWSNATCTTPQKCSRCGETSGGALGHQYASGYCIRCNEKDPNYVEYGTIKGTVTYKYNNYVGNRGDTGATVILFPNMTGYNTKEYDNGRACLGFQGNYESGIMVTTCDGSGEYIFDNVPAGRYYLLIISKETTDGGAFDNIESRKSWIKGNFSTLLNDKDISRLTTLIGYQKIFTENIDVIGDRTHTISKDFGVTYI